MNQCAAPPVENNLLCQIVLQVHESLSEAALHIPLACPGKESNVSLVFVYVWTFRSQRPSRKKSSSVAQEVITDLRLPLSVPGYRSKTEEDTDLIRTWIDFGTKTRPLKATP